MKEDFCCVLLLPGYLVSSPAKWGVMTGITKTTGTEVKLHRLLLPESFPGSRGSSPSVIYWSSKHATDAKIKNKF